MFLLSFINIFLQRVLFFRMYGKKELYQKIRAYGHAYENEKGAE